MEELVTMKNDVSRRYGLIGNFILALFVGTTCMLNVFKFLWDVGIGKLTSGVSPGFCSKRKYIFLAKNCASLYTYVHIHKVHASILLI